MIDIDEKLRIQVAESVLKDCKDYYNILISRIEKGNNYINKHYSSLDQDRYNFLTNGLNKLKSDAKWIIEYSKQIRVKYSYYKEL